MVAIQAVYRGQKPVGWCILAFFIGWIALLILVLTIKEPSQKGEYSYHETVARQPAAFWYCKCGYSNPIKSPKCIQCSEERPEYWTCTRCGTKNYIGKNYCSNCFTKQINPYLKNEDAENLNAKTFFMKGNAGTWQCKKCGTTNSNNSDYCINCCEQKDN